MKKNLRILSVILSVSLCLMFSSCGVREKEETPTQTSQSAAEEEETPTQPSQSAAEEEETPTQPSQSAPEQEIPTQKEKENVKETQFYIKANGTTFVADFADNSSADALRELLHNDDLTMDMHDYGNFEKVGEIGQMLPQNNTQITTVPGDVILYLGTNITIYYDRNSWNFTRLGKIQNATKEKLLSVFGKGNVTVTFSSSE